MWARWWANLALIDVLLVTGSAAGAVWLSCTYLVGTHPAAAVLLAALSAISTFTTLTRHRRP